MAEPDRGTFTADNTIVTVILEDVPRLGQGTCSAPVMTLCECWGHGHSMNERGLFAAFRSFLASLVLDSISLPDCSARKLERTLRWGLDVPPRSPFWDPRGHRVRRGVVKAWTIWQGYLDYTKRGKGKGAFTIQEDNIDRVDRWLLQDRTNKNNWIRVYDDISNVINDILKNGAQLAIVLRNLSRPFCDRTLYYFNAINPKDGKEWTIIDLAQFDEIKNESKANHWRRIRQWAGCDYSDMLMFDDEALNNVVRIELGEGSPLNLLAPYRWGFAWHVTASVTRAKFFLTWNNNFNKERSSVCEVWVKDYDAWIRANKIWVPENNGNIPLMNNMTATAEATGRNQEDRDRFIGDKWGVPMPYVLFCQHHWFNGFPPPQKRWTELVIYTQIYRTLFEVVPLKDADLNKITDVEPFPYGQQIKPWRITVPAETRAEFLQYKEKDLYDLSA
ncbi:hypothetical protein CPB83DRAFT_909757 [Crepidotus variabilis]|uniref:Uncharacterized protein n=1 Tax=Crepidotus variabilis TaxID=179855 RepID=A0A9P6E8I2_9AGAR|nr:hypothetical protein CPB83DRAFT_909757 [Crepidotus variabilis]